jgi:hypothetical protein
LGKFVEKNTVFDNFDVFVDRKNHLLQGPVVAKSRMVHILFAKVWGLATSCSRTLSWKSVLLGHVAHRNHRISIVVWSSLQFLCLWSARVYDDGSVLLEHTGLEVRETLDRFQKKDLEYLKD